ncbi:MAG: hypothetical protein WCJ09_13515 [Planctomycetota bacterium]
MQNELEESAVSKWMLAQLPESCPESALAISRGRSPKGSYVHFHVRDEFSTVWAPGSNTGELAEHLHLDPENSDCDLEQEILFSILLCPVLMEFPSLQELISTIRIRAAIVQAARRASLAFATYEAERPADYWHYDEDRGFVLLPGKSLISALEKATNSGEVDKQYTFSCRRASEYLVLLGLAREARNSNTVLYQALHHQAETRALKGREFEQVFVRTIGSTAEPLPVRYFIPGDRTWFRNIDPVSAEVTGYEGSWTFYLGSGKFADFWRRDRVFTLETKLVCVYHWRNAVFRDAAGELQIDEQKVDALISESCRTPRALEEILHETLRLQSQLGTSGGGCIEPHRERPCLICPETTEVILPDS